MPGLHAKLSPSAAKRWMNCPGSVALIGDESSTSNAAAMKGTAAHKVIELMIEGGHEDARDYLGYNMLVYGGTDRTIDEPCEVYPPGVPALNPKKPRPDWFLFIVDQTMVEGVQMTIDEVHRLKDEMFSPELIGERFLDMSEIDDRLGGTADVTLVEPFGWAHLIDHKNGFILVEAVDNDQLKNYAVGIMLAHPDCEGVRVTISQPNAPHVDGPIRSDEFTRAELQEYAQVMKRAADETSKPNALRRPGDWCTFCPAKTRCKEFDDMLTEEAIHEFDDELTVADEPPEAATLPVSYTNNEELARKARWTKLIKGYCTDVMKQVYAELAAGNKVPGWKMIYGGKTRRRWPKVEAEGDTIEEEEIGAQFVELGVPENEVYEPRKIRSPAQMEKLGVGKEVRKEVKKLVRTLQFKPQGKPTVVEDCEPGDPIDSFNDASDEFSDGDDEEDFL